MRIPRPGLKLIGLFALSCASLAANSIYCATETPAGETGTICDLKAQPVVVNSFDNVPLGFLGLSPGLSSIQVSGFSDFGTAVSGAGTIQAVDPPGGCVGGFCTGGGVAVAGGSAGGGEAVVNPSGGIIQAAVSNGTAIAGFGDTLTLSQAGTITLNGSLTGFMSLNQGSGSLKMAFEFYDPSSFEACGDDGSSTCADLEGGVTVGDFLQCLGCTYGPGYDGALSYPFSTTIDLPAGATTMFVYLFLQTSSIGLDFSDPLTFSVTAPAGDTLTSLDGIPISSSTPEPSTFTLTGVAGALFIFGSRRENWKRNRQLK
jgi:hypothetical protein